MAFDIEGHRSGTLRHACFRSQLDSSLAGMMLKREDTCHGRSSAGKHSEIRFNVQRAGQERIHVVVSFIELPSLAILPRSGCYNPLVVPYNSTFQSCEAEHSAFAKMPGIRGELVRDETSRKPTILPVLLLSISLSNRLLGVYCILCTGM